MYKFISLLLMFTSAFFQFWLKVSPSQQQRPQMAMGMGMAPNIPPYLVSGMTNGMEILALILCSRILFLQWLVTLEIFLHLLHELFQISTRSSNTDTWPELPISLNYSPYTSTNTCTYIFKLSKFE